MRYIILRDDDTNALTPVECLERLYRPFLERNLPVNLAVIPGVATNALTPQGKAEGFLFAKNVGPDGRVEQVAEKIFGSTTSRHAPSFSGGGGITATLEERSQSGGLRETVPIGENAGLVKYLHENSGYKVVQHGCHHDCFEFELESRAEISARLERGTRLLTEAGFPRPVTFVAPHDKLFRASYREVAKRFRVISSGWFELRRLPLTWWPKYLVKKTRHAAHWRAGGAVLLSHPGCLLSAQRNFDSMRDEIIRAINRGRLTVLVTHWWEYFSAGTPNERFIQCLHETAEYLASREDIKVISFADLAQGGVRLN
jgi:hypothetical protein